MSFPLYDKLSRERSIEFSSPDTDISQEYKEYFLNNMKTFDKNEHEVCYALIRKYQLSQNDNPFSLPYNGKQFKKGIRFDFEKLPNELKQILYLFMRTHLESLNQEIQR